MDCYVFVYGTLKRGGRLSAHMYRRDSLFISEASLQGFAMYDAGWFPAISRFQGGQVKGEIWKVDEETLKDIDGVEGVPALYRREEVRVEIDRKAKGYPGREEKVWTYIWNRDDFHESDRIVSGLWPVDGGDY